MSDDETRSVRAVRLGLELRQIRRELNLTLKEACELTRRSKSSISRIENGQVVRISHVCSADFRVL